jgi:hypothetical protein
MLDNPEKTARLGAAGYNFSLLLRWFEELTRTVADPPPRPLGAPPHPRFETFFTADYLSKRDGRQSVRRSSMSAVRMA